MLRLFHVTAVILTKYKMHLTIYHDVNLCLPYDWMKVLLLLYNNVLMVLGTLFPH